MWLDKVLFFLELEINYVGIGGNVFRIFNYDVMNFWIFSHWKIGLVASNVIKKSGRLYFWKAISFTKFYL